MAEELIVEKAKKANKVYYGEEVLIDLTQDTVTEDKVLEGYTFHKADGEIAVGTAQSGGGGGVTSAKYFTFNGNKVTALSDMGRQAAAAGELQNIIIPRSYSIDEVTSQAKTFNSFNEFAMDWQFKLYSFSFEYNGVTYNCSTQQDIMDNYNIIQEIFSTQGSWTIYIDVITFKDGDDYQVTQLGDAVFYQAENILSIELQDNITTLGDSVFQECSNLSRVIIPTSVTSVGAGLFYGCKALTKVNLPNTITSFESGMFSGSGITEFTIPATIDSIPEDMFNGCANLKQITIPSNIKSIGRQAFQDCTALRTVDLGQVEHLDYNAFAGCVNLIFMQLPSSLTTMLGNAFQECYGLQGNNTSRELVIPPNITNIMHNTFAPYNNVSIFDFSNFTQIPTLDSVYAFPIEKVRSSWSIRVPANLYDQWIQETNWVELVDNIWSA